ncbi:MAG: hypothetical protein HKN96_04340 [Flavobacteriaceae bacterium]|nr:hypothetical protein [Flavobacteriaceae bacterium]
MKTIPKYLFFCVVMFFACQTERLGQNDQSSDNQSDQQDQTSEESCETLFARGEDDHATCFLDDGFSRWGWTNGSIEFGDYSFDLYSGAGQCVLDNGTLAGTLTVNYDEATGTVDIDYEMNEGFVLNETHLYVGNEPYPTDQNGQDSVAPGQFPYQHELDGVEFDSYTVDGLSGPIYIIAHGLVCNDGEAEDDGPLPE